MSSLAPDGDDDPAEPRNALAARLRTDLRCLMPPKRDCSREPHQRLLDHSGQARQAVANNSGSRGVVQRLNSQHVSLLLNAFGKWREDESTCRAIFDRWRRRRADCAGIGLSEFVPRDCRFSASDSVDRRNRKTAVTPQGPSPVRC